MGIKGLSLSGAANLCEKKYLGCMYPYPSQTVFQYIHPIVSLLSLTRLYIP